MLPRHIAIALILSLSLGVLSACTASSPDEADTAKTESTTANSELDSAWAKARAGENPSTACAKVKGSLITDESDAARKAVAQCNYDIPVKYFTVLLDQVDAGSLDCNKFMRSVATQLSSLTMSVGGLKRAAQTQGSNSANAEAGATDAISTAVTSDETLSASDRVKAALAPRAVAACPVTKMYFER